VPSGTTDKQSCTIGEDIDTLISSVTNLRRTRMEVGSLRFRRCRIEEENKGVWGGQKETPLSVK